MAHRLLGYFRALWNWPYLLELAYLATDRALRPFRPWLKPGGLVEGVFIRGEKVTKGVLFNCQMCGQCVLHSSGMTCPMTCPKNLRNGPCGGVRADGHCEVIPQMRCVWVQAWERSNKMRIFGAEILKIQQPVDGRLAGTSAWINHFTGAGEKRPVGWSE